MYRPEEFESVEELACELGLGDGERRVRIDQRWAITFGGSDVSIEP
jgi:hypothetical protein